MSNFEERLINERNELDEKCRKLNSFLFSDAFNDINARQQGLLEIQHRIMLAYLRVLDERIGLLD